MAFEIMTVGDMMEGFINNMSEEQIDKEIRLFQHIKTALNGKKHGNIDMLGVLIDKDNMINNELAGQLESSVGYRPYFEENEASGYNFLYFKNMDDTESAAAYLEKIL